MAATTGTLTKPKNNMLKDSVIGSKRQIRHFQIPLIDNKKIKSNRVVERPANSTHERLNQTNYFTE